MATAVELALGHSPVVQAKEREQVKKAFTDVVAAAATQKLAEETLRSPDDVERVNRLRTDKGDIAQLERLRMSEVYLPRAARARDTVDYAYRRGRLSVLDLLDAQRTYRETALDQIRALGSFGSAIYQLEAAVGGPLAP